MNPRRHLPLALLGAAMPGLLLVGPLQNAATAAPLPDLKVVKLTTGAAGVEAGDTLTLRHTIRNTGKARAGRSKARYYLSKDAKASRTDVVLGTRKVPALKPGARHRGSFTATVPADTAARGWYVLACADATKQVKEGKERNNCRATSSKVTVTVTEPPPAISFPMEPNPLSVSSTLQTDRAVTVRVFPHEDQTVQATAADGTTYTLVIPAGALLGPEDITMTPVASVPGLPLSGGLVAGVQIEPHGLMLLEPAELTIESPDAGSLDQQTGFLFHEEGADFHLFPMDAPKAGDDADVIRMSLTHFSTPGIGSATSGDRDAVAERVPARTQAQAAAAISDLLRQERANQLNGAEPNPEVTQQVTAIMNALYDDVIRQQMQAAETNADLAAEAIAAGLGWSRQMQLLGDEDNPRHAEIMERVEKIMKNVMNENWQDCLDHDLSATLDLFRVGRVAALMGYTWEQEALDKALGCGRFEIRFDSEINAANSWSGDLQNGSTDGMWHTSGTVLTEMLEIDNTGPLGWVAFSYTMQNTITDPDSTCHLSETGIGTAPGQLRASATPLLGSINVVEGEATPPPVPVQASVGVVADAAPTETYEYTTCDGSSTTSTDSRWHGHYEDYGKNWVTDPTQQAGDFIDSKTFTITDSSSTSTQSEVTTVEVWHKPSL